MKSGRFRPRTPARGNDSPCPPGCLPERAPTPQVPSFLLSLSLAAVWGRSPPPAGSRGAASGRRRLAPPAGIYQTGSYFESARFHFRE
ncbi:hypothetical protein JCM15519_26650 [Fundidesulfovibrio butyratiphilus]